MSQHDYVISNQSFPSFRSDLNNALSAIQTCNSGTSRPTGAVAGQIWLDTTSATSPTLKYYDGADDISLATLDHSANTVNWLDSTVSVTGLSTTATGTVLTLTDTVTTSSVNLIIDNQKEIRFNETTANGTNYIGLKAPASLASNTTFILPSADGTAGQFLKTDGAGNLSFSSVVAGVNTPYFYAYKSTSQTITSGVITKIDFGTEDFDTNSNFASSRFTPTTAGKYYIETGLTFQGGTDFLIDARIYIYKNGTQYTLSYWANQNNYGNYNSRTWSSIIDLNGSSDYVEIYANSSNSNTNTTMASGRDCWFQGFKLIE